jgi:hypothetical protein
MAMVLMVNRIVKLLRCPSSRHVHVTTLRSAADHHEKFEAELCRCDWLANHLLAEHLRDDHFEAYTVESDQ